MTAGYAPRYWLARLSIALNVLVTVVLVSWFEDTSLTASAIRSAGGFGWVLVLALGAVCGGALIDAAWNDMLPVRFVLRTTIKWRHLGFMAMALLLSAIGFLVAFTQGFTFLLLVYWLNAALAAGVTFLDVFARMRPR